MAADSLHTNSHLSSWQPIHVSYAQPWHDEKEMCSQPSSFSTKHLILGKNFLLFRRVLEQVWKAFRVLTGPLLEILYIYRIPTVEYHLQAIPKEQIYDNSQLLILKTERKHGNTFPLWLPATASSSMPFPSNPQDPSPFEQLATDLPEFTSVNTSLNRERFFWGLKASPLPSSP